MRIRENIKSLFLCFLIGLSIYLTGSLWFDNYQGLSLVLANIPQNLRKTFGTENVEYSQKYVESIVPYKLTIASPDYGKWVLYYDLEDVVEAWNMTKTKFTQVSEKTEVITGNISEWKDLIHRKSIIFEFGDTIDIEVLKLVLPNLRWINQADFNNINKIAITKSIDGAVIYVDCKIDDKDLLYKILLKEEMTEIEAFIDGYINKVADAKYVTLEETGTTKLYSNRLVVPNTDVLFPISNKLTLRDPVRRMKVDNYFTQNDAFSPDRIAVLIFQNTDYAKFVTGDNGKIYINDDKSYVQVDSNGVIEYINKGNLEEVQEVSSSVSYNVALDFIDLFDTYKEIYLLSASKVNQEYNFYFFLSQDGIPLISSDEIIKEDFRAIIQLKVKNGVVQYFKGKLIATELKNISTVISNFTKPILDELTVKMKDKQSVMVENIQIAYDIAKVNESYPVWCLEYKVGNESGRSLLNTTKK